MNWLDWIMTTEYVYSHISAMLIRIVWGGGGGESMQGRVTVQWQYDEHHLNEHLVKPNIIPCSDYQDASYLLSSFSLFVILAVTMIMHFTANQISARDITH